MEVLELKPVKDKKVYLYLVEKEDNFLYEHNIYEEINEIAEKKKFRFAIIDFNDSNVKKIYQNFIAEFSEKFKIPYYSVDMPENARDYLCVEIIEKKIQIKELEAEYENLCFDLKEREVFKAQNLKSWIGFLKKEVKTLENNLEQSTRPKWIVKKVLDIIHKIEEDKFSFVYFAHENIIAELKQLFKNYNIKVIDIDNYKKKIKSIIT